MESRSRSLQTENLVFERVNRVDPEALGQELDGQGQIAEPLGRARELLEAVRGSLDQLADLAQGQHHLIRGGPLLVGGEGDLPRRPGRVGEGRTQLLDGVLGRSTLFEHLVGRFRTLLGRHDHRADRTGEVVEERTNRIHRFPGSLGQAPDLLRNHAESIAVLAGRRGLDGGVEGEDVGLLGDLGDEVQDPVDLPRSLAENVGAVGDGLDPVAQLPDPVDRALEGHGAGVAGLLRPGDEISPGRWR